MDVAKISDRPGSQQYKRLNDRPVLECFELRNSPVGRKSSAPVKFLHVGKLLADRDAGARPARHLPAKQTKRPAERRMSPRHPALLGEKPKLRQQLQETPGV
jgi:hypothetical protein